MLHDSGAWYANLQHIFFLIYFHSEPTHPCHMIRTRCYSAGYDDHRRRCRRGSDCCGGNRGPVRSGCVFERMKLSPILERPTNQEWYKKWTNQIKNVYVWYYAYIMQILISEHKCWGEWIFMLFAPASVFGAWETRMRQCVLCKYEYTSQPYCYDTVTPNVGMRLRIFRNAHPFPIFSLSQENYKTHAYTLFGSLIILRHTSWTNKRAHRKHLSIYRTEYSIDIAP